MLVPLDGLSDSGPSSPRSFLEDDGANLPIAGNDFYRVLLDSLVEGVYFLNRERRIRFWSRSAERITGYTAEEVLGRRCADNLLCHVDCGGVNLCDAVTCPAASVMASGVPLEARLYFKHKEGHRVPISSRVAPVRDNNGRIVGAIEVFHDSSAEPDLQDKLARLRDLALVDPLTGIGNRRRAEIELVRMLGAMERYGWRFGVLFVDIDDFKLFNDRHGHAVGDRVLRMVAQTLARSIRSFDEICRWGGEEFLILLTNVRPDRLLNHANRLRRLVESSAFDSESGPLQVTVSIGATLSEPGDTLEAIVERGDRMMYSSKRAGRNRVTSSHPALRSQP